MSARLVWPLFICNKQSRSTFSQLFYHLKIEKCLCTKGHNLLSTHLVCDYMRRVDSRQAQTAESTCFAWNYMREAYLSQLALLTQVKLNCWADPPHAILTWFLEAFLLNTGQKWLGILAQPGSAQLIVSAQVGLFGINRNYFPCAKGNIRCTVTYQTCLLLFGSFDVLESNITRMTPHGLHQTYKNYLMKSLFYADTLEFNSIKTLTN